MEAMVRWRGETNAPFPDWLVSSISLQLATSRTFDEALKFSEEWKAHLRKEGLIRGFAFWYGCRLCGSRDGRKSPPGVGQGVDRLKLPSPIRMCLLWRLPPLVSLLNIHTFILPAIIHVVQFDELRSSTVLKFCTSYKSSSVIGFGGL